MIKLSWKCDGGHNQTRWLVSTQQECAIHTLKYKTAFSLRFFKLFAALSPVETDVVALIARPEHNLQARTSRRRFRSVRTTRRLNEEGREEERYFIFLDDGIFKTLITCIEPDIVYTSATNCNFIDHKSDTWFIIPINNLVNLCS